MVAASDLLHYPAVTVVENAQNFPDINITVDVRLIDKFAHSRHRGKKKLATFSLKY